MEFRHLDRQYEGWDFQLAGPLPSLYRHRKELAPQNCLLDQNHRHLDHPAWSGPH